MVLTHRTARKRKQVVVDFKLDDKFVTDFKFVLVYYICKHKYLNN